MSVPTDGVPQPHVLYVAWGFPPCRGGGVYRALATANALAEAGMSVTVLTADRDTFVRFTGTDESLEARIDPSITVHRVAFDWPALEWDLRKWPKSRIMAPKWWEARRRKEDQKIFPEPGYGAWRPRLEQAAEQIHRANPIDVVVTTANPAVDYSPAWYLYRTYGVPYFADQRDGWTLDVFSGDRLHEPASPVGKWETDFIGAAQEFWVVNEPIHDWYAAAYPEVAARMRVVMNGWDDDVATADDVPVVEPHDEVRFAYVGPVSKMVPLPEFIDGWRLARSTDALGPSTASIFGYLGFFHTANASLLSAFDEADDDQVIYAGPVPKAEVHTVYENADVLLLMLGAGKYVTSGKVFEFMASGLPIVSIHDLDNACTPLLRDYPGWFPAASLSAVDIADALSKAAAAARTDTEQQRQARVEYAQRFRRDRQLAPAIGSVAELAAKRAEGRR